MEDGKEEREAVDRASDMARTMVASLAGRPLDMVDMQMAVAMIGGFVISRMKPEKKRSGVMMTAAMIEMFSSMNPAISPTEIVEDLLIQLKARGGAR